MKKRFGISFSIILSFCLLFTLVGTASAKSVVNSEVNPTVTPITGITNFTVTLLPILDLPGQTTTTNGLVVPTGFPAGEKQFEGKGTEINGLTYGTAKACFPITAISQGWGGKVGLWDGKAWKLLDTTITTPEESSYSLACATIYGDGTYALLKWVDDPSKLPGEPNCSFSIEGAGFKDLVDEYPITGTTKVTFEFSGFIIFSYDDLENKTITVSLINVKPSDAASLSRNPHGKLTRIDSNIYNIDDPATYIFIVDMVNLKTASLKFDFGSCKLDLPFGIG